MRNPAQSYLLLIHSILASLGQGGSQEVVLEGVMLRDNDFSFSG